MPTPSTQACHRRPQNCCEGSRLCLAFGEPVWVGCWSHGNIALSFFTPPCSWAHGGLEFTCSGDPTLCQQPAFEALLGQEAGGQFWTLRWGLRAQRCPAVLWSREEGPTHGEVTQGCVVRKVAEGKALMADPRNERPAAECPASPVSMGLYPRYPADSVIPCHSLEWRRRYARCLALGPSHSLERVLGAEVLLSGAPLLRPHDTSCFLVWVSCRFH